MIPEAKYVTIDDNVNKIQTLLSELVLMPRLKALEWSSITKQTPNMKIGYPGQHLASLITGVEGARTGARGDDLVDGSEVKSCSRVDQLDNCKDCKQKVLRVEANCPHCGSNKVNRMNDSKWLFGIKSEEELNLLTKTISRVFLTLSDYPNYHEGDFDTIRFQAFEIWNNTERHKHFTSLMENYYHKIFLEHIKRNPNKTPAPKNFWPYSYQFYLCNPVKVFNCIVENANTAPEINIDFYVDPKSDRSELTPEPMPSGLLTHDELIQFLANAPQAQIEYYLKEGINYQQFSDAIRRSKLNKETVYKGLPTIPEVLKDYLILRDTDKVAEAKTKYSRR